MRIIKFYYIFSSLGLQNIELKTERLYLYVVLKYSARIKNIILNVLIAYVPFTNSRTTQLRYTGPASGRRRPILPPDQHDGH